MEPREPEYLRDLVRELCALESETAWVEFKVNNTNPNTIGKNISALANSAVLHDRPFGYVVWGVDDETHEIIGTEFSLEPTGEGPREPRIRASLSDNCDFQFYSIEVDHRKVVILEVNPARQYPVRYRSEAFIRVGSATKPLQAAPQLEARLWRLLDQLSFEDGIVAMNLTADEILKVLDYPSYFDLLNQPLPDGNSNTLDIMRRDRLIGISDAGGWDITNLAAILLGRDLNDFRTLARKRLRVIRYDGSGRSNAARERQFDLGYASAFQRVIEHIMALVPTNEVIENALNIEIPMFPEVAVRELVANAVIHQDFHATGSGPMVEIFEDRIEVTNPGQPLVETLRFLDAPPKSRNETIASLMRRFGICEERGSGIDKVVDMIEVHQLPAPLFEVVGDSTRCVLFAHKDLSEMSREERIRACYWHACLRHLTSRTTNNQSIRERFGIPNHRSDQASRLLKEAVDSGMLIIRNPDAGNKSRSYLPNWDALPSNF